MNPWENYQSTYKKRIKNGHFRDRLFHGGRAGTRTLDPLIKSQLLYQLSYASRTEFYSERG